MLYSKDLRDLAERHHDELLSEVSRGEVVWEIFKYINPSTETNAEEYLYILVPLVEDISHRRNGAERVVKSLGCADFYAHTEIAPYDESVRFWLIIDIELKSARKAIEKIKAYRNANDETINAQWFIVTRLTDRSIISLFNECDIWVIAPTSNNSVEELPSQWLLFTGTETHTLLEMGKYEQVEIES